MADRTRDPLLLVSVEAALQPDDESSRDVEAVGTLRRVRVILDDNRSGVASDHTFSARTSAAHEARQLLWEGQRKVIDDTR